MRHRTRRMLVGAFVVAMISATTLVTTEVAQATHRLNNKGHWDRTGAVAHVKFLDYTGGPWPVGTAHVDWDYAYNIDVDWVVADASPVCGPDCATVRALLPSEDPFQSFGPNCTGAAGYWQGCAGRGRPAPARLRHVEQRYL